LFSKSGAWCAAFLLGIRGAPPAIALAPEAPDIPVINDGDDA
jgi:hypothetical protein